MMDKGENRLLEACTVVGGVLLLIGAAVRITGWDYSPWIFATGSFLFAAAQFSDSYQGNDAVMKRLRAQQILGALFLLLTAMLMFTDGYHLRLMENASGMNEKLRSFLLALTKKNSWIVTLTIAAVFELFSSLRMEKRQNVLDEKDTERQ